ncbi:NAD(P)-dependent oxidoreductase [Plasticicumulans acidivorans]|uniref:3-hydroxyisobutyrate dehydrogenase-like beta-hydroxyacid dehydrogenase n=1 Tax=Plasticicumulans acidivorans TaxID=886464 RepID=A0A317MSE4_9GAMM|nr:NAD(P)-dependent oxidoreductase [Plasticicumulans acidivorans]PWV59554.1 3-hydroxyisobutyrate dehydrogenase-like beta-hydroxyacid dehydrogenase [Plasticicumulans acidivorans]
MNPPVSPDRSPVGFIGLGLMGRPMALNLLRAGYPLSVHSRSPEPVAALVAAGARAAATPAELAAQLDCIVLMLTDTPAVATVLAALLPSLRPGTLIIDMGTSSALATRDFAAQVRAAGADWLDAPVSGGVVGAENANLTIMAGGETAAFARAEPLLRCLGARLTHVGGCGCGQIAKAANQMIVGLSIGAVAEALALAARAGADPARVREALRGGFADSRILELHGLRMIEGRFEAGGRVTTQHKDMTQALELAAACGMQLPATALNRELYARLIAAGDGGLDHSALYRFYTQAQPETSQ